MSLTKHYAPLMIPLALHDEPTHPEFHCYPASEVDALSQDCAVLRQEIKDNEEELAKTQGALDEARKEIKRLEASLDFYASEGTYENDQAEYGSTWVTVPHTAPIYSDNGETARQALAAADGQQKCGDGCLGCTQCFKPLEDSDKPAPSTTGDGVEGEVSVCEDCPPKGYPTDRTRCWDCPRSQS